MDYQAFNIPIYIITKEKRVIWKRVVSTDWFLTKNSLKTLL